MLCLPLSLPLPYLCSVSLSVSQKINKHLKTELKKKKVLPRPQCWEWIGGRRSHPSREVIRPGPGRVGGGVGEGREAPGSRVWGRRGDEEGALMSGLGSGVDGGACPHPPVGLKVCRWRWPREGPARPAVCPESALHRSCGTFRPHPVVFCVWL